MRVKISADHSGKNPISGDVEIDAEIGKRLRSRREMLGLTQTELAQRCEISPQQCHKYESGASSMRAGRLVQFSNALGVPIDYFFSGFGLADEYPDDLLELFADRMNSELIRLFNEISEPSIRYGLLEMMRAVHRAQSQSEAEMEELGGASKRA